MVAGNTVATTITVHTYLACQTVGRVSAGCTVLGTGRAGTRGGIQVSAQLAAQAPNGSGCVIVHAGLAASNISNTLHTGTTATQSIHKLSLQAWSGSRKSNTIISTRTTSGSC